MTVGELKEIGLPNKEGIENGSNSPLRISVTSVRNPFRWRRLPLGGPSQPSYVSGRSVADCSLAGYVEHRFVLGCARVTFRYERVTKPRRSRTCRLERLHEMFREIPLGIDIETRISSKNIPFLFFFFFFFPEKLAPRIFPSLSFRISRH